MFFEGVHDLFHGGSAFAEHQCPVLIKKFVHIGLVIPHDFGKNIEVQMSEKPVIGFSLKECSETVFEYAFVVTADGFGGEVGDSRKMAHIVFGGVVPQIDFFVDLFDPLFQDLFILALGLRLKFLPGSRVGDLHDDVVRDGISRDIAAEIVCHHGYEARNTLFFQAIGDGKEFFPEECCRFVGVAAPFSVSFKVGFALFAAAAPHGVIGHQVEKGLVVRPLGVAFHVALCNGFRTGQNGFGILIDLFHDVGTETEVSAFVAGDTHHRTVGTLPVGFHRKIFRMGFGKTPHVVEISKSMAVGERGCGHPETAVVNIFSLILIGDGFVPFLETVAVSLPEDPAVLRVRAVINGHGRNLPVAFPGKESAVFTGEIKTDSGKTFQKFQTGENGSLIAFGGDEITSGDKDMIPESGDHKAVAVDLVKSDLLFCGKRLVPVTEDGNCGIGRKFIHRSDLAPCDFRKESCKFSGSVPDRIRRFGRNVQRKLHLAVFNQRNSSFFKFDGAGTDRLRGELLRSSQREKRKTQQKNGLGFHESFLLFEW